MDSSSNVTLFMKYDTTKNEQNIEPRANLDKFICYTPSWNIRFNDEIVNHGGESHPCNAHRDNW